MAWAWAGHRHMMMIGERHLQHWWKYAHGHLHVSSIIHMTWQSTTHYKILQCSKTCLLMLLILLYFAGPSFIFDCGLTVFFSLFFPSFSCHILAKSPSLVALSPILEGTSGWAIIWGGWPRRSRKHTNLLCDSHFPLHWWQVPRGMRFLHCDINRKGSWCIPRVACAPLFGCTCASLFECTVFLVFHQSAVR